MLTYVTIKLSIMSLFSLQYLLLCLCKNSFSSIDGFIKVISLLQNILSAFQKCIAPLDDKNLCGKYIFCPCNDDECKKVRSFVIGHDDTEKIIKIPKTTIFTHYISYFNFWKTRNEHLDFGLKLSQIGVCKDIIIEARTMLSRDDNLMQLSSFEKNIPKKRNFGEMEEEGIVAAQKNSSFDTNKKKHKSDLNEDKIYPSSNIQQGLDEQIQQMLQMQQVQQTQYIQQMQNLQRMQRNVIELIES
ncbi:hypothetical protein RFI_01493 [Reticulomyxa filosa]|uniref:Uncharacterized protein n=1 Tax=Reticulomyxa filosa TaxID=46433 RepID=X6PAK8_RETFI|nr:hypothetical protein RFI_01493 [Reticulomyxa filosa]|eukprot:ETO35570.1 hypothetical protein RFI_01493 [Reticulomyxa filosa]